MKLENISFNVDACSSMSFNEFKKTFEPLVTKKKLTIEEIYFMVTGRQAEQEVRKTKVDEPIKKQYEKKYDSKKSEKSIDLPEKSIDLETPSE
jgi:hypothetical protein